MSESSLFSFLKRGDSSMRECLWIAVRRSYSLLLSIISSRLTENLLLRIEYLEIHDYCKYCWRCFMQKTIRERKVVGMKRLMDCDRFKLLIDSNFLDNKNDASAES